MKFLTSFLRPAVLAGMFAASLLAGTAQAQGAATGNGMPSGKIGFINTERILKESAPAKAAQQKLEALRMRCRR